MAIIRRKDVTMPSESIDVADIIKQNFPKAEACAKSGRHIGRRVKRYGLEIDDDRYSAIKYYVCGHCGIPVSGDEYIGHEEEMLARAGGLL